MSGTTSSPSEQSIVAWARLVRVSQNLLEAVEADLKAAGMPPLVWYDALLELRRNEPDGLRPFELQDRMLLAQYNLSRLLDRIVKAGYAERRPCPEDGRGHVLHVTAAGRDLLQAMWPPYRDAIARRFADRLDDGDAAELGRLLGKLQGLAPAQPTTPPEAVPPSPPAAEPARRVHRTAKPQRRVRFFAMKPRP
jgi:DNA-binding MarR family transcriptional regulator